jgi:hypothetical protein
MSNRVGVLFRDRKMWFEPKEDITTWELAKCMDLMLRASVAKNSSQRSNLECMWNALPGTVTRHFE